MTFGQAAELRIMCLDVKVSIQKRTRKYWREIHAAMLKSWRPLAHTGGCTPASAGAQQLDGVFAAVAKLPADLINESRERPWQTRRAYRCRRHGSISSLTF